MVPGDPGERAAWTNIQRRAASAHPDPPRRSQRGSAAPRRLRAGPRPSRPVFQATTDLDKQFAPGATSLSEPQGPEDTPPVGGAQAGGVAQAGGGTQVVRLARKRWLRWPGEHGRWILGAKDALAADRGVALAALPRPHRARRADRR